MLTNYHTHTTYCDGESTPEEIVIQAIGNGFSAIGFSGHGYTPFDLRYCMKDTSGYREEIFRLKRKYGEKIQIYCGVEEDAFSFTNRADFDYSIGSSHYICVNGNYYPIDSGPAYFQKCLELFDGNAVRLAEAYYSAFTSYIARRKPDIVGHFDLITKYDECGDPQFLHSPAYLDTAEKYMKKAAENDVIFEVNTGAIARGLRKTPYPHERLLYTLKEQDGKLILSSDSHSAETLHFHFSETEALLRDIGFKAVYELYDGTFKKRFL
ncbi:MAG: histidinol-phosphatase HisJ family protein [Ruminococcaceae bacterium]|nr:histidinol-phosphatase HisJ family protein [Oscillospiraceae bacterium]